MEWCPLNSKRVLITREMWLRVGFHAKLARYLDSSDNNHDNNMKHRLYKTNHLQKFTIHWRDDGTLVDSAAYIYLDEFEVPGYFLFGFGEAHRSAARIGPILERPFVFSKADEGELDPIIRQEHGLNHADIGPYPWHPESGGVVQLAIKQVKRVGRSDPNASRQPPEPNKDGDGNPNNRYKPFC